jgi:RNA polymerase sigma-70 factor (ECF subfamily)
MTDGNLSTAVLQEYLGRWRAGDQAALNELLQTVFRRLRYLAAHMLRGFPNLRPYADCDDLLQGSMLRFVRTLRIIQPRTTRDFFNLAAVHMRRELMDLARRAKRRIAPSSLHAASVEGESQGERVRTDVMDSSSCPQKVADFEVWVRFHELVDNLPIEEREVVGLIFYHGWRQQQIAELFNVSVRTVRRRWETARQRLRAMLQQEFDR